MSSDILLVLSTYWNLWENGENQPWGETVNSMILSSSLLINTHVHGSTYKRAIKTIQTTIPCKRKMAKVLNDIPTGYKKASAAEEQNARSGFEV